MHAAGKCLASGEFTPALRASLHPTFDKQQLRLLPEAESTESWVTQVGVGALVLNEADEILLVQERRGPAARPGFWKMPTGLVDVGEAVGAAAVREVAEETGVAARLESIVSFREVHGVGMAGKSDLFFVCACRALSTDIRIQESEIADAKVCENRAAYVWYTIAPSSQRVRRLEPQ
jgi:ADP-ribose pyrophosphatase YjhB (NUDIX family)